MADIESPFTFLPPTIAFRLGITLISISLSIIITYSFNSDINTTRNQQFVLSTLIGIVVFLSVSSSVLAQQIFSYVALIIVVLFPVIVGYLGFQELVLRGVFYGP